LTPTAPILDAAAAYAYSPWIALAVAVVMITVVASYRQNVHAYDTRALQAEWERREIPVPLTVVDSPYREITRPIIDFVKSLRRDAPRDVVTVYIPEYVAVRWWENLLHNQSALHRAAGPHILARPGPRPARRGPRPVRSDEATRGRTHPGPEADMNRDGPNLVCSPGMNLDLSRLPSAA
jgi:hypothetical protein